MTNAVNSNSSICPSDFPDLRIVSLIASATEIVWELGYGAQLVGRSHECDYPAAIAPLPACSEPRINVHAGSREIDNQVRAAVQDALSIYRVFVDRLQELHPTHIITQSQCEVCAVSLKDVEQAVCQMVDSHPRIVSLAPMDLAGIWGDIRLVAEELRDAARGDQLVTRLQQRLNEIRAGAKQRRFASEAGSRSPLTPALSPEYRGEGEIGGDALNGIFVEAAAPSVVCLEWLDPLMSAGNWVPELVEIAGGRPLLCQAGTHSPYFAWEDLLRADPGVIAIMPCGFDIPRTVQELSLLTSNPHWRELSAVRSGRVYVTDGNQYFNRPGPRVVESAEILAEVLHDDGSAGSFRHHGAGWVRLSECSPAD